MCEKKTKKLAHLVIKKHPKYGFTLWLKKKLRLVAPTCGKPSKAV